MTPRLAPRRRFAGTIILVLAMAAGFGAPATAQNSAETTELRRQVRELSRQVEAMREELQRTRVAARTDGDSVPPTVAAQFEIRLSQLERELQEITGRVEEFEHQLRQTNQRLDRLENDLEFRISELEGGRSGGSRTAGRASERRRESDVAARTVTEREQFERQRQGTSAQQALPEASASEQYTYAINLLRQQQYRQAEAALAEYIERYPDGALTANAYYWLGETHFVQRQYREAAVRFADGYRNFSDHAYAPRNLLKLGMSLARIDREADACETFAELNRRFPDAGQHIHRTANEERERLGCR